MQCSLLLNLLLLLTDAARPEFGDGQALDLELLEVNASRNQTFYEKPQELLEINVNSNQGLLILAGSQGKVCDFINGVKGKIVSHKKSVKRLLDIMNIGAIMGKIEKLFLLVSGVQQSVDGALAAALSVEGAMGIVGLSVGLFVNVFKYLGEKCLDAAQQNACAKQVSGTLVVLSIFSLIFFVVPVFSSTLALTVMNPPAALALSLAISLVSNFVRLYGKSLCDYFAKKAENPVEMALDAVLNEEEPLNAQDSFTDNVASITKEEGTLSAQGQQEVKEWVGKAENKRQLADAFKSLKQKLKLDLGSLLRPLTSLLKKMFSPLATLVRWLTGLTHEAQETSAPVLLPGPSVEEYSADKLLGVEEEEELSCDGKNRETMEEEENMFDEAVRKSGPGDPRWIESKKKYEEQKSKKDGGKKAAAAMSDWMALEARHQQNLGLLLQAKQRLVSYDLHCISLPDEAQTIKLLNEGEAD